MKLRSERPYDLCNASKATAFAKVLDRERVTIARRVILLDMAVPVYLRVF